MGVRRVEGERTIWSNLIVLSSLLLTYNLGANFMIIERKLITIPSSRQRSDIDKQNLLELVDSILKLGLLHPPSFSQLHEGLFQLVAGGRRLAAIDMIAERKLVFLCDGQEISPGFVPCTLFFTHERLLRFEAELEENIIRVDLPWPDRVKALAKLHQLRSEANPKQTQKDTAAEIANKSGITSETKIDSLRGEVQRAIHLAPYLANESVARARNEKEAYQLALASEDFKYQAELVRRKMKSTTSSLRCDIRNGNALEIMPKLDDASFDLILSDPPYGVEASAGGYRNRTVHHHNYDDSFDNARRILQSILTEGWRLCKPKANLLLFTDIKHFAFLQEASSMMGWTPWRYPVIWQKSTAEGLVPWGRNGFVHTYDVIFFATKGRKGTNATNVDILNYSRVSRNQRVYAAEKPVPLLSRLIELTTMPGDSIFDPCAGSGSTLIAAKQLKRHSLGIEIDPQVCDLVSVRINQGDDHADFSIFDADTSEPPAEAGGITIGDVSETPDVSEDNGHTLLQEAI